MCWLRWQEPQKYRLHLVVPLGYAQEGQKGREGGEGGISTSEKRTKIRVRIRVKVKVGVRVRLRVGYSATKRKATDPWHAQH